MSEERELYTGPSQPIDACGMLYVNQQRQPLATELYAVRAELEEIERRLIPLLVTVQRALGKEPSVITRSERRRG